MAVRRGGRSTLCVDERRAVVSEVVCGHIHQPALRPVGSILYCNSGDWVESCTAVIEHFDGRLELVSSTPADTVTSAATPAAAEAAAS